MRTPGREEAHAYAIGDAGERSEAAYAAGPSWRGEGAVNNRRILAQAGAGPLWWTHAASSWTHALAFSFPFAIKECSSFWNKRTIVKRGQPE